MPGHFLKWQQREGGGSKGEEDKRMCGKAGVWDSDRSPSSSLSVLTNHFVQINHQKQTPVVVIGWLP